jgi:hypothetical protein
MRIRLDDRRLLGDLLSFMREAGCIAYYEGDTAIEVLRPTRGGAEAAEIKELLALWNASNPGAGPEIVA